MPVCMTSMENEVGMIREPMKTTVGQKIFQLTTSLLLNLREQRSIRQLLPSHQVTKLPTDNFPWRPLLLPPNGTHSQPNKS